MYKLITYSDELYHYGVKGMHWGVRRYQNYDGTRIGTGGEPVIKKGRQIQSAVKKSVAGGQGGTAKGNARYAATAGGIGGNAIAPKTGSGNSKAKDVLDKATTKSIKQGKGKDDISPAEKISRDVRSGTEATKKVSDIMAKHDPKVKSAGDRAEQEAKKMSDKELRDSINRIKMEREYRSLAESDVQSGWQKASEVLDLVGDVASITLAIVGVIATIKSLKQSDTSAEEAELKRLLDLGGYDDDFIAHAMDLDLDYINDWLDNESELYHHGVKGMKWGVRRYQNYDGSRIGSSKEGKTHSTLSQDFRANYIKKNPHDVAYIRRKVSKKAIRDLQQKHEAESKAIREGSEDIIRLDNYMTKYERDAINWAKKDLKKSSDNDTYDPEFIVNHAKQYMKIEPYNPPITDKVKEYQKAHAAYEKALVDYTNDLIGAHGDEPISSIKQEHNGDYHDSVFYVTRKLLELESLGLSYDRSYQYEKEVSIYGPRR